jgi:hypothetical protein
LFDCIFFGTRYFQALGSSSETTRWLGKIEQITICDCDGASLLSVGRKGT